MYHPDDHDAPDPRDGRPRFTCCGGREAHRIGCDFEDDDDAIASVDDEEDEDADEFPDGR